MFWWNLTFVIYANDLTQPHTNRATEATLVFREHPSTLWPTLLLNWILWFWGKLESSVRDRWLHTPCCEGCCCMQDEEWWKDLFWQESSCQNAHRRSHFQPDKRSPSLWVFQLKRPYSVCGNAVSKLMFQSYRPVSKARISFQLSTEKTLERQSGCFIVEWIPT